MQINEELLKGAGDGGEADAIAAALEKTKVEGKEDA